MDRQRNGSSGVHTDELWDEDDGFFYDVLRMPDGQSDAFESALDGRTVAIGISSYR